jgi:hypothetical protein
MPLINVAVLKKAIFVLVLRSVSLILWGGDLYIFYYYLNN